MRTKWKVAIVVAVVALAAAACFVLGLSQRRDDGVSLTFQRYSDLDPGVSDVAFLGLTNVSGRSYLLTMTGNTNTLVLDTAFGHFRMSWMVNCEFSDQTPAGRTNWSQLPSPVAGRNAYATLAPHSGLVVRVPVPPTGQRRRVAVLYQPTLAAWQQSRFWISPFGFSLMRILVRTLPRSIMSNFAQPQPVLLKAWCDRELTNPWDTTSPQ